ncbi:nucleotidyltransferase domain-containing protein [Massilia agri]|uniref:Nucleotidyltransferase family protein n=1 Tax=Massilia agri TaxID=1886785 RepID=A0ABT2AHD9_9BURK|nr:nucleotidyltransferase family protein [Massilia agri]MCS0595600.1 nucleotidyltransferase family protein [Massilia agri]
MKDLPLLLAVLRQPQRLAALAPADWDLLLRQAVAARLAFTLYLLASEHGLLDAVPARPRAHLEWAAVSGRRHHQAAQFEARQIADALARTGIPLILLKGSAYLMAGLPASRGRLFSDIDILVPQSRLDEVEAALMLAGWKVTSLDAYDQRYYRTWMHELPPMQHMQRGNTIDVHHAILPLTARVRPDPEKLRAAAVALPGHPGWHMLAPVDMVLHSATHLFHDGEFDKGLRDLFDIHRLLQHFGAVPGFWDTLPARACELQLARPLFYALRYSGRLFGTAVPPQVVAAAGRGRPNPVLLRLMDALFERALQPDHESCADRFTACARFALYVRGNWLRMPPLMLAQHLFHKAFISPRSPGTQGR